MAFALAVVLASCGGSGGDSAQQTQEASTRGFIVVFDDAVADVRAAVAAAMQGEGGEVGFTYQTVLKGFSVRVPSAQAEEFRQRLLARRIVKRVEEDLPVSTSQTVQSGATWGLDRVDQASLPLSTTYSYTATGAGVRAYIIDTGILETHTEFTGRVEEGFTAIDDGKGTTDCNGHGTHVAGTVGGTTWGIAKAVTLVPVRVLGCRGSGNTSGVIAGMDWVATNATLPAVVNMSLGGAASQATDEAVARMVGRGVTVVVAAGNDGVDACGYSPARAPEALTIGATTMSDLRAGYSNYGTCLDLFAPGSSITSAWYTSPTDTNTISGTSMASPHVAGLVARFLQGNPAATPAQVADEITSKATQGEVAAPGTGSPNRLAFGSY